MDWNDVRYFLALARSGSVRSAGTALGVSHSTVARRVEALEEQLAARLFDRSRDGYALTDAGEKVLVSAERIEAQMCALEREMAGQDERFAGRVAITCCDDYVGHVLADGLRSLCHDHPDVELTMVTDSRPFDLAKREADIAIRALGIGTAPPEYLIGTKIAPLVVANYVAKAHRHRLDPAVEGSAARWVSFDDRPVHEAMIAESSYPNVPAWGAFSTVELLARAARAGFGIAMLPTYVGDREPELERLAHPDLRHLADLWLLSHPDLRDNVRLRATRAQIVRTFAEHAALFSGEGCPTDATGRPEIEPLTSERSSLG